MLPDFYYIFRRSASRWCSPKLKRLSLSKGRSYIQNKNLNEGQILFIYETICPSQIYRVRHAALALQTLSIQTRCISISELIYIRKLHFLKNYRLIIFHRLPWNSEIRRILKFARKFDVPVLLDLDDYIFDPRVYQQSAIFEKLNSLEKKFHIKMAQELNFTLKSVDAITVSTPFLNQVISSNYSKQSFVVPNCVTDDMLQYAARFEKSFVKQKNKPIIIGYVSGTSTHDRDILTILPIIEHFFSKKYNIQFHLFGPISLPEWFSLKYHKHIKKVSSVVPWPDIHKFYSSMDINVAPLESNNSFCMAKSPIKYLEAGINRVPTIASSIPSFSIAIRHGKTGFLAGSDSDWIQALELLINDHQKRLKMGTIAQYDILHNHHISTTLPVWETILSEFNSR